MYICQETNKIVPLRIIAVNGLSHKKLNDPSLINKDLLRFSSIIPPKTKARIKGGMGKLYSLKKQASTANNSLITSIIKTSSYSKQFST